MTNKHSVEVTFDHKNRNWRFRPLDRSIRGRFVRSRAADRNVRAAVELPEDIPGQIAGIDTETGTGYIVEPLHHNPDLMRQIGRRGFRFQPERTEFAGVDVQAWLYFMQRAVEAGKARLVQGEFPQTITYREPSNFLNPEPRGEERLRRIFYANPPMAREYMRMNEADRVKWQELVGV